MIRPLRLTVEENSYGLRAQASETGMTKKRLTGYDHCARPLKRIATDCERRLLRNRAAIAENNMIRPLRPPVEENSRGLPVPASAQKSPRVGHTRGEKIKEISYEKNEMLQLKNRSKTTQLHSTSILYHRVTVIAIVNLYKLFWYILSTVTHGIRFLGYTFVHYPSYSLNFGAFAITSASRLDGSCS